jgi:hypothetical protein
MKRLDRIIFIMTRKLVSGYNQNVSLAKRGWHSSGPVTVTTGKSGIAAEWQTY